MGVLLNSFLVEVGLLLAGFLVFLVLKAKRRYRYFEERDIKYLKPTLLIGNMGKTMVGLEHMSDTHARFYKALKGEKMGGVFQAMTPLLIIRDPELVHKVLIKDFGHFHDRGFRSDTETNPLEGHLFMLNGELWRTLRNKLSPTFTSGKLKGMFPLMEECMSLLLGTIDEKMKSDNVMEVSDILACFTTDVIGSCAFGYEPSSIKDPNSDFRVMGRRVFRPNNYEVFLGAFRFGWPDLFFRFKIRTVSEKVNDFFFRIVRTAFDHRLKTGQKRNDFIQLLLQLREKGSIDMDPKEKDEEDVDDPNLVLLPEKEGAAKINLTDELLTAQAFVFFIAGFETSATTMTFTLYYISKDKKIQDKVREEIRTIKAKHGGITYQAVKEMVYLESCLKESLRLSPPIAILNRECTKTYRLDDGRVIEKGQQMVIPVMAIQRDPDNYPEPEVYNPDRFAPGVSVEPGTYMPFGDGPRICIGQRFAWVEAKMGLANILDKYSVELSSKTKEPIQLNNRAFVTQPLNGIWINFSNVN